MTSKTLAVRVSILGMRADLAVRGFLRGLEELR